MATVIKVNPPGLASTDEGYISSITIYTGGSATVLTPSTVAATYGEVTVSDLAAVALLTRSKVGTPVSTS